MGGTRKDRRGRRETEREGRDVADGWCLHVQRRMDDGNGTWESYDVRLGNDHGHPTVGAVLWEEENVGGSGPL